VVYETLQMSQLEGYYTGGTIHFIINNQIGFTTDFEDARSSTYCTSIASTIQAPVLHVNGDDPEAVVYAATFATEYRQKFNSDIFIDMVCYRRHGHNEGDDPKFTQPEMYEIISKHPNVRELYINVLERRGDVQAQLAEVMEKEFWDLLQERLNLVKENPLPYAYQEPELAWKSLKKFTVDEDFDSSPDTGIPENELKQLLKKLLTIPENFSALPKIKRLFKSWEDLIKTHSVDWALAELLAYASILADGKNVRMSGQDVKRGTFSHRHAVLFEEKTNASYNRLSQLHETQGKFLIYNSLLSEFGVLGFEYGYSLASPNHLVLWEAQFGDFSNGAQVIIDQFISTAQSKWNRMSGIVLLLPHGYDGQGPEHSSARLERFLQSCAERNMVIANVSTPSNFFHLIRRQLSRDFRTPLLVMAPKSLLRHPKCVSNLFEFYPGNHFKELIEDPILDPHLITEIIFCSGQIYYDLKLKQEQIQSKNKAIIRIEQLYPFPTKQIEKMLLKFPNAKTSWVQEEPLNMGAASFIKLHWNWNAIQIIARPASASTAVGFKKIHDRQLQDILETAFN
ncbi:MAG: 2-oxoglutarate dehydrogenase E1 component, partial [Saprospiraceae bacterium]